MESTIKRGLEERYADKEIIKMWNQFWKLAKVVAVFGILWSTHTMQIFFLIASVILLITAYKVNKIAFKSQETDFFKLNFNTGFDNYPPGFDITNLD